VTKFVSAVIIKVTLASGQILLFNIFSKLILTINPTAMNNQLIFQTGFEYVCNQFNLDSLNIFNALSDIYEAGLELMPFSRFSKNLSNQQGYSPLELEVDELVWLYLCLNVITYLSSYHDTTLGNEALKLLNLQEIIVPNKADILSLIDIEAILTLTQNNDFKTELLENIKQTEFTSRSNLMHWFYYRLTQGLVNSEKLKVNSSEIKK
jgi:hypothetical protein